jgi:Zn-dependent protease
MLINLLFQDPISFFSILTAILLSLSVHEYFHAWTSYILGDETAKEMGRLTINPLAHIDFLGLLFLLFFGFGWGKPVPYNPYSFKNKRWAPSLVAISGPISNFLMVGLFSIIYHFLPANSFFALFSAYFIYLNLMLGVFNLIPVVPLDGSHLLFALFKNLERYQILFYQFSFVFLFFALMLMEMVLVPFLCDPLFKLITGFSMI